ncbi:UNKNOWN [Stylonychia lemnae]|uniref:Uncharacterized protein n=1 Tax=Stylonychia lemnae TaxID=5949 RepID=A0A077ZQ86_STYLE|nr:UNKNOWN [Stylonychia lemnae]|eukprot:CDW72073.1 UNKNOWN [Stylonychia lemnae]
MLRELPGINNHKQQQPETKNVKALDEIPQFVFISEEETDQIQRNFDDVKTKRRDASLIFAVQKNGQNNNKNTLKLQYFGSRNMDYDYLMLSENQIRRLSDVFQYDQAQPYTGSTSTETSNGERILTIKNRLREKRSSMQLVQKQRGKFNESLSNINKGIFDTNSSSLKLNLLPSENDQKRSIDETFFDKTTKSNLSQRLLQKKKNQNLLDSTSVYSSDYFPELRHHTVADSTNLKTIDFKHQSTDSNIQKQQGLKGLNLPTNQSIENKDAVIHKDSMFEFILNKYSAQKRYENSTDFLGHQIVNYDAPSFSNQTIKSTQNISAITNTLNQQNDLSKNDVEAELQNNKKISFVDKLRNIKIIVS